MKTHARPQQPSAESHCTDEDIVVMGKIGRSYGVKGMVKIHSYSHPAANLLDYRPWYLSINGDWVAVTVESCREHSSTLLAKLAGYDTPEQVKALTSCEIAVPYEQLPALADDEYYWRDLEGLTVITEDGVTLGTITQIIATGAKDVLVIQGTREHLLPFVMEHVVKEVNLEQKKMIVAWDPEF